MKTINKKRMGIRNDRSSSRKTKNHVGRKNIKR